MRAAVGEDAAVGCERDAGARRLVLLREPVALGMGARDRRNEKLSIGVLRPTHDRLDGAGFGEVGAVQHEDRIADLISGREVMRDVEDRDPVLVGESAQ